MGSERGNLIYSKGYKIGVYIVSSKPLFTFFRDFKRFWNVYKEFRMFSKKCLGNTVKPRWCFFLVAIRLYVNCHFGALSSTEFWKVFPTNEGVKRTHTQC